MSLTLICDVVAGLKSSYTSFSTPDKTEKSKLCSTNSLTLDANENSIHARKELKIKGAQHSEEKTLTVSLVFFFFGGGGTQRGKLLCETVL